MIAIYSTVSLLFIVGIIFFAYQTYRVDKLRQDLFAIRDQLFDEALDGKINFDDDAYRISRQLINGMIRFAHRLSIPNMFAFALLMPRSGSAFAKQSINEMLVGDDKLKQEMFGKYQEMVNARVAEHVVSSPLFVLTAFVPLLMIVLAKLGVDITKPILRKCNKAFQILDNAAYAQGASA
jgi:hypothetical protein